VVSRRGESGYAMMTAVMVILLVSIALGLLATSLQIRMRQVREEAVHVVLTALSDAAVAEAMARLAESGSFSGAGEREFGGGRIASQIRPMGPGLFAVTATAEYADRKRIVEVEILRPPGAAPWVRRWRRLPG
jgi:hypothetical protein